MRLAASTVFDLSQPYNIVIHVLKYLYHLGDWVLFARDKHEVRLVKLWLLCDIHYKVPGAPVGLYNYIL